MKVQRFDHTALAIHDMRPAAEFFCGVLGAEMVHGGDDDGLGIRTVQLRFPEGSKVELVQPLSDDSGVARFLARKGEGLHHITFFVDDVEEAVRVVREAGFETVDPKFEDPSWREVYIRPASGFGTLIQLADSTKDDWTEPTTDYTLEDVLEGRVVWVDGGTAVRRDSP